MSDTTNSAKPDPVRAVELELGGGPLDRAIRAGTLLIVAAVLAVLAWTLIARVDEIARAMGQVKPIGDVQVVESRDGGRIEELLVRDGDRVRKGDVIARFKRTGSEAELKVALAKQATLLMEIKRHTVFAEGGELDLEKYRADFPWIVARELDAFAAQRRLLEAEQEIARVKLAEKRAERLALDTQIPAIEAQKKSTEKSLAIYESLSDKQLASKIDLAKAIQEDAAIARQLAESVGRREVVTEEIREVEKTVEEIRTKFVAEALEKRATASAEARQVQEQLEALKEKVEETVVRSPVDGVVQSVPKTRAGEVIEPGGKVAEIVPAGGGLQMVVRLAPRDVGFVRKGQPAKVKIDAFDYSRYGALAGTVERVSPTTFVDERGIAYYEVAIALAKSHFGNDPAQFGLVPGMTGEADIKTGDKTVFQYLWKPVYESLDLAFSER
jgi:HlyD family type I secretion membrane fusion protein